MLNIVICDDNERVLNNTKLMVEKILSRNMIEGRVVYTAAMPDDVLAFCSKNDVNVVIVDIDLKSEMNGMALAQALREKDRKLYIIFLTGHLEYLMQAYKVKTFDYIPKPVTYDILEQCILSLYEDYMEVNSPLADVGCITIKSGSEIYRLRPNDITYIERLGCKTIIHTCTSQIYCYDSLESLQQLLGDGFIRCHKSFIVNEKHISIINIGKNEIVLDNNAKCSIGRKYKKEVVQRANNTTVCRD